MSGLTPIKVVIANPLVQFFDELTRKTEDLDKKIAALLPELDGTELPQPLNPVSLEELEEKIERLTEKLLEASKRTGSDEGSSNRLFMSLSSNSCTQTEMSIIKGWKDFTALAENFWKEKQEISRELEEKLRCLISSPFKTCSTEFYNFLKMNNEMIRKEIHILNNHLELFFFVESYLRDKTPDSIEKIKSYLEEVRKKDFDACGIKILRKALADGVIVRNVYRSGDKDLVQLFRKYLPKPDVDLFKRDGGSIPDSIAEEAKEADATIETLTQKHGKETLERCTITMQRRVRGRQKSKRELLRVMNIEECDENEAKKRILDGNTLYMPKCKDRNLAKRIFNAAKRIPNPLIIRHVASAQSFATILDGCLYGRQSLAAHYIPFRAAALYHGDQENGDANAICFGPQEIDEQVWKKESVEIILDMKKFREKPMERLNPCIFFKQQDLGYSPKKRRKVTISKDASIEFNHTASFPNQNIRHRGFTLFLSKSQTRYAQVPFQQLISSNFKSMTAIQTLNFFRFLDCLTDSSPKEDPDTIDTIYGKIAQLDDQQLANFLVELHNNATDTAEFNFYGAYRIDPELIESIRYAPNGKSSDDSISVCPPTLIKCLNEGDLTLYKEIREKMPFLFESKRFVNFLSSKVKNPEVPERW
jgi:hypothetical protein